MSFTVSRCKENDLSLVRLQDNATNTIVTILPEYGALLHSFEILLQQGFLNIIDNYSGKNDIDRTLALSYKSSKLSPFVCRIQDGKYTWNGQTFEFARKFIDGSAIHGLLFNKPFAVTNEFSDDSKASVTLRYHYKKEDPGYPFDYVCEVRYTLHSGQVLQIETTILNLDDIIIPVTDGWHPYFQLGCKIDDCIMQFNSDSMLEFTGQLIPTGKLVQEPAFINPSRIGNKKLDNCFFLQPDEGKPCCVLHNPGNGVTLSIFTNALYPYLQIYTPDHRNSIAIENLSGAPDSFNNGQGLLMLAPRHSQTFNVWYRVDSPLSIEN